MKALKIFTNGIVKENPLLVLSLGLCSSLAVTTSVFNGIGMGASMMFVLLMSEIIISIFRKLIPDAIRLPVFIIVIAAFTTIVQLLLGAYLPDLSDALGVFLPLIVVNCIIMGRVEAFASKTMSRIRFWMRSEWAWATLGCSWRFPLCANFWAAETGWACRFSAKKMP